MMLIIVISCHLDRASNVEIGVECQIFVIVIIFLIHKQIKKTETKILPNSIGHVSRFFEQIILWIVQVFNAGI